MDTITQRLLLAVVAIVVMGITSGCATIVHLGGSEQLTVNSEPSGATVEVDGAERGVTPMSVKVERKQPHKVTVKKEGYEDSQTSVDSKLSLWVAGNIIFGGVVGLLVDVLSGGGYTLEPSELAVSLQASNGIPTETGSISSLNPSPPLP